MDDERDDESVRITLHVDRVGDARPSMVVYQEGDRVGRYEILAVAGTGGMGVVYRAFDTKLEREVALKVPWHELARHPDARRRFTREARAAARLFHPNIVQVHEVFEIDDLPWLSLQFVRGESLRAILARGERIPTGRILEWATELTRALEHAHANDILHRDIKPGNILIADDGRPMLTDFGLARRISHGDYPSEGVTASASITGEGRMIGTLAYMSPEQALGRTLDERSDLFSLGAVLYEMCTGRPLITAETRAEARSALMDLQPPPIRRLNPKIPKRLERIVQKAVAWRAEDRYASAAALRADLEAYAGRRRRSPAWVLAGTLAVAAVVVWFGIKPTPPPRSAGRVSDELAAAALITWPSREKDPRLSPDGEWVSFISTREGKDRLWLRSLSGTLIQPLTSPESKAISHVWSTDGRRIAYLMSHDDSLAVRVMPSMGGPSRVGVTLDERFGASRLVRWIGDHLYLETGARVFVRIDLSSGDVTELVRSTSMHDLRWGFDILPDESRIVYSGVRGKAMAIWTSDPEGSNARALTSGDFSDTDPRWLDAGGKSVVFTSTRGGQLDLWRLRTVDGTVEAITLSEGAERVGAVSPDGQMLVYVQSRDSSHLWQLDPSTGWTRQLTADALSDSLPSTGRDTNVVAFQRQLPRLDTTTGHRESRIFSGRLEGRELVDLVEVSAEGDDVSVSHDGEWVAIAVGRELWIRNLGTEETTRMTTEFSAPGEIYFPGSKEWQSLTWHPERLELFFVESSTEANRISRFRPGESSLGAIVARDGSTRFRDLRISPDGGRLAYFAETRSVAGLRLHVMDLDDGRVRELPTPVSLFSIKGWLDEQTLLIAVSEVGLLTPVRLVGVGIDGTHVELGGFEKAYVDTVTLDPDSRTVYATVEDDKGIQNVEALSLGSGASRLLTNNAAPNVGFSTTRRTPDGSLIFARREYTKDIWSIEFKRRRP